VSVTSSATPIRPVEDKQPVAARARALLMLDPLLMLAAIGVVACSLVTLHVAARGQTPGPSFYVERQAIYAVAGLIVATGMALFDYSLLRRYRYLFYTVMIGLNLVVLGMPAVNGGHRWIPLPLFQFQSSEFGKILLIVSLGAFLVDRARRLQEWRTTMRIMLLALLPAAIVTAQPDLGTSLVYAVVGFTMLFVAGTSWKQLTALITVVVLAAVVVLAGPSLGVHVLKTYQQQRLTTFINPPQVCNTQKDQTCYQMNESLIAIGSGQKTGRGAVGATQTELNYLPAPTTDFVFAALGETYGFVGAALVLSLYALLIWRTLRILMTAKNLYGTVIAGGVLGMFMFQIFVSVGMTLGIMPTTGVPLPLMTYGGSSVIVTFIAIGLLQSIYVQGRMANASKGRVQIP
jgi:rod shape determining protein RodA